MNEEEDTVERNFRLVSIGTPRADVSLVFERCNPWDKIFFPEFSKAQVIVQ